MQRAAKVTYTYNQHSIYSGEDFPVTTWSIMTLEKDEPLVEDDIKWYLLNLNIKPVTLVEWEEIDLESTTKWFVSYIMYNTFDPQHDGTLDFYTQVVDFPTSLDICEHSFKELINSGLVNGASYCGTVLGWSPMYFQSNDKSSDS